MDPKLEFEFDLSRLVLPDAIQPKASTSDHSEIAVPSPISHETMTTDDTNPGTSAASPISHEITEGNDTHSNTPVTLLISHEVTEGNDANARTLPLLPIIDETTERNGMYANTPVQSPINQKTTKMDAPYSGTPNQLVTSPISDEITEGNDTYANTPVKLPINHETMKKDATFLETPLGSPTSQGPSDGHEANANALVLSSSTHETTERNDTYVNTPVQSPISHETTEGNNTYPTTFVESPINHKITEGNDTHAKTSVQLPPNHETRKRDVTFHETPFALPIIHEPSDGHDAYANTLVPSSSSHETTKRNSMNVSIPVQSPINHESAKRDITYSGTPVASPISHETTDENGRYPQTLVTSPISHVTTEGNDTYRNTPVPSPISYEPTMMDDTYPHTHQSPISHVTTEGNDTYLNTPVSSPVSHEPTLMDDTYSHTNQSPINHEKKEKNDTYSSMHTSSPINQELTERGDIYPYTPFQPGLPHETTEWIEAFLDTLGTVLPMPNTRAADMSDNFPCTDYPLPITYATKDWGDTYLNAAIPLSTNHEAMEIGDNYPNIDFPLPIPVETTGRGKTYPYNFNQLPANYEATGPGDTHPYTDTLPLIPQETLDYLYTSISQYGDHDTTDVGNTSFNTAAPMPGGLEITGWGGPYPYTTIQPPINHELMPMCDAYSHPVVPQPINPSTVEMGGAYLNTPSSPPISQETTGRIQHENEIQRTVISHQCLSINKDELDKLFENLKEDDKLTMSEPDATIATKMYPHQKQALHWMTKQENNNNLPPFWTEKQGQYVNSITEDIEDDRPKSVRGGVLADDMGLGKTLVVIALIMTTFGDGKSVVLYNRRKGLKRKAVSLATKLKAQKPETYKSERNAGSEESDRNDQDECCEPQEKIHKTTSVIDDNLQDPSNPADDASDSTEDDVRDLVIDLDISVRPASACSDHINTKDDLKDTSSPATNASEHEVCQFQILYDRLQYISSPKTDVSENEGASVIDDNLQDPSSPADDASDHVEDDVRDRVNALVIGTSPSSTCSDRINDVRDGVKTLDITASPCSTCSENINDVRDGVKALVISSPSSTCGDSINTKDDLQYISSPKTDISEDEGDAVTVATQGPSSPTSHSPTSNDIKEEPPGSPNLKVYMPDVEDVSDIEGELQEGRSPDVDLSDGQEENSGVATSEQNSPSGLSPTSHVSDTEGKLTDEQTSDADVAPEIVEDIKHNLSVSSDHVAYMPEVEDVSDVEEELRDEQTPGADVCEPQEDEVPNTFIGPVSPSYQSNTSNDKHADEDNEESVQEDKVSHTEEDMEDELPDIPSVEDEASINEGMEEAEMPDRPKGTLIVCPLSVMSNWRTQLKEHLHESVTLNVHTHHGPSRNTDPEFLKKQDIVLTTYNTVARDAKGQHPPLKQVPWLRLVLDEGHAIRNPKAQQTKAILDLKARMKWVLTGTPIQNSIRDLWSIVRFLQISPLTDKHCWLMAIEEPLQSSKHESALKRVQHLMGAIALRRTKNQETDGKPLVKLPARKVFEEHIQLGDEERRVYEAMQKKGQKLIRKYMLDKMVFERYGELLVALLRLRQLCCHPQLVAKAFSDPEEEAAENLALMLVQSGSDEECSICLDSLKTPVITPCGHIYCKVCIETSIRNEQPNSKCPMCRRELNINQPKEVPQEVQDQSFTIVETEWQSSAKVDALMNSLVTLRRDDPTIKSLVVSQFTSFLRILEIPLRREGFLFTKLDGTMSIGKRRQAMEDFKSTGPDTPSILLLSLKAGGVGINLIAASRVFLMEPAWNPASEEQCFDRCHRLGQTRDVLITKFVIEDSVEERMLELQEKKRQLMLGAFKKRQTPDQRREERILNFKNLMNL